MLFNRNIISLCDSRLMMIHAKILYVKLGYNIGKDTHTPLGYQLNLNQHKQGEPTSHSSNTDTIGSVAPSPCLVLKNIFHRIQGGC